MNSTTRIILLANITILLVSLIQGFPQELKLAVQPNPIISNGVYRQAKDSYGNPVAYLEAAEAPDGRKFVHTGEGIQFEIPKYASGITEIKKPSDDLLPPLVPVPPSRLFTPPVFGRPEISTASNDDVNKITEVITDLSKGSNPNTFSGAPTTSFAERLNFNKNVNQNIGIQGVPTPNSITDIDNKPGIQLPNSDLQPPIISPTNQFVKPTIEEQPVNSGQKQVQFANNPFLSQPTGTQQQISQPQPINAGGFLKNSASVLNKNNNNNFNYKNNNNNKFTGTFGGAPGILGNQKPGYAVRPTVGSSSGNTITSNTATKPIAITPSAINKNPPNLIKPTLQNVPGKYTGGFGGPPGILAPFDNIQQRAVT